MYTCPVSTRLRIETACVAVVVVMNEQGTAVGGYMSSMAKKQGLGWLTELEEDDEEDQKPLL